MDESIRSGGYIETKHLSVFITGRKQEESWNASNDGMNFYTLKGIVKNIIERLGIKDVKLAELSSETFSQGLAFNWNKKLLVEFGEVAKPISSKLMDIKMPLLDGYTATRIIKKKRPELPIIAQTAYAMLSDKQEADKAGCDGYLSKPIRINQIEETLEIFLLKA